ncbi:MAG TPA: geranylgeranyl reductase family protein [Solirubrobacteraceae bacterium]|nr:geranylgeranyl reductase family protein [Solirubrobacteraceae bacterium]
MLDEAEIAVVGAGPAGSIAAFTLAERGHDVILIDKCSFPRDKACGDGLTSSAVAFLYELGLERVLADSQPIDGLRVFVDWRERESTKMSTDSADRSHRSCCIPRKQFDHALVELACAAGARLVHGYVTQPLRGNGSVVGIELARGAERLAVYARHVMAADGATSRLRRQLSGRLPPPRTFSYAVRRYVRSDQPLTPLFEIYAPLPNGVTNYGYGWLFPVGERAANVGLGYLSTPGLPHPRSINELLDSFLTALRRYQGHRLGNLDPIGRPIGGTFGGDFAPDLCQLEGVIFIGDAGQVTDPITGEGIDQAMRSSHAAALTLDRAIRRHSRQIDVVQALGRANLRLGQDSSMIARLAHDLLKRRDIQPACSADLLGASGPLLSTAAAMLTANRAYPSPVTTPVGELASRLGCADQLVALDDQLREEIHSDFPLAAELLLREVCAGVGPVAAFTVFASELACGSKPGSQSVDAALCAELLSAFPTMLSRVASVDTPYANTNNALAVMIADHSLCRALAVAPNLGAEVSEILGKAIEANSEGVALLARGRGQVTLPVERYIEWARLTSGTHLSLAASLGTRLAGADPATLDALRAAGESLGVAMRVCEDILALARDDPVTGRHPRNTLEEGHFSLPVLLALEEDSHLAPLLTGERESAEWDEIVDLMKQGQGLARAAEVSRRYAEEAKRTATEVAGGDNPLIALCDLLERCLAPLASLLLAEPEHHPLKPSRKPVGK